MWRRSDKRAEESALILSKLLLPVRELVPPASSVICEKTVDIFKIVTYGDYGDC